MPIRGRLFGLVLPFFMAACAHNPAGPAYSLTEARWDALPQSDAWTKASLAALDRQGAPLVALVPRDIDAYCPGYKTATAAERKAFWVNLISALAKHESTWQPGVAGGGGRWIGLLQISPGTARNYGCKATDAAALRQGPANLSCGIRIMASTVARDGVISEGMRGVAADWGPFHSDRKRDDIQAWTRSRPYCRT